MKMNYRFPVIHRSEKLPDDCCVTHYDAVIRPIRLDREPYEATVEAFGCSYHLLFGSQINGNFLCIPDRHFGCELAGLTDVFWNLESFLSRESSISRDSAVAIVYALKALDGTITP